MERYEILGMVGEGSFGKVYKSKIRQTDEIVAFKVIRKHGRSEKDLRSLRRECEIQQHLNHPNIIHMLDSFETENEIVVVTEYADEALNDVLAKEGYLPEERVRQIVCDLVSALYYLHSHRVLHRDLKPQNILMGRNGVAKLCDFGFARSMSSGTMVLTSLKGTPLYMAPELIEEKPYDHNADLWSLGCIVYELLVGAPPFCTTSIIHLVRLIQHEAVKWPDFLSPVCKTFIQGLLQKDPNHRLLWPDLLNHPFVKNKVLIFHEDSGTTSLTQPLTKSQTIAKEIQKQDLVNRNAGQTRVLAQALQTVDEYEKKLKCHQNVAESLSLPGTSVANSVTTNKGIKGSPTPTCSERDDLTGADADVRGSLLSQPSQSSSVNNSISIKSGMSGNACSAEGSRIGLKVTFNDQLDLGDQNSAQLDNVVKGLDNVRINEASLSDNEKVKLASLSKNGVECKTFTLADWDSSEASHPIENDEWLAFLQRTMEEVMDGEVDSMHQVNFLSIALSPLRNPSASPRVVEYVASLLCLPFIVDGVVDAEIVKIRQVYLDVKAVPNLVYASKLVTRSKGSDGSADSSPAPPEELRSVSDLSADELQALECIYLLICNLVHASEDFLIQFCDAVLVLKATPLLQQLLLLGRRKVRVVTDLVAILCEILRAMPENAALVEGIVLGRGCGVDFHRMLTHYTPTLRERACKLLRLLGRYSCRALQRVWDKVLRESVEALTYDSNETVQVTAKDALRELKTLAFYDQNSYQE